MKRAVLILLLYVFGLSVESVSAQELDGLYYPFGNQYEHLPEIDLDSTLFYLPVSDESTLFDRLTRYSLSSVRFVRRGVEGEVLDLDGVQISRSESYLLRRLLRREQVVDGMAAEPIDAFIFGHMHFPRCFDEGALHTLHLGCWEEGESYAQLDKAGRLTLN